MKPQKRSNCIQKQEALNYLSGTMSSQEADRIKSHLLECQQCRTFLKQEDSRRTGSSCLSDISQIDPLRTESISPQFHVRSQSGHPSLRVESLTDGYTVLEELSQGGQAVIYKAIQKSTRRTVVVKILPLGAHASKRARYRFEREIEMAAGLQHPNIVTIFDSGITEGKYFYAMEYIEGLPLDDYINAKELSQNEIMALFEKVASATAYAHRKGIIHRDLKPANILINKQGQPHILDFGLAKVLDSMQDSFEGSIMTSMDGELLGTLAFMSPEQAAGKSSMIDVRTDVYSIGVMLYQALTKVFPYPISGPLLEVLKNVQEIVPEKPSKVVSGIKSDIEAITLKALSKEPERRYQSANELSEDIRCFLEDRPITAKSDSSIYILQKMLRKHRYAGMVFGLLVLIILGFSLSSIYLYTKERTAVKGLKLAQDELTEKMQFLVEKSKNEIFINFLKGWHVGRTQPSTVAMVKDYLHKEASIEHAVRFLGDPSTLSKKIDNYLETAPKDNSWFSFLIVAEAHYKNKNFIDAEEYYLKSYQTFKNLSNKQQIEEDSFFVYIKSRLYELVSKRNAAVP